MKKLNFSRKIDEQGRISLPVKYRELVGLTSGTVVDFYEHKSNGHLYLCIQVPDELVDDVTEEQAENAKYILEKYLLQQKERKQKS